MTPALLLIMMLIVGAGRVALADQAVQHAANQAARAASLERSPGAGVASAKATAAAVLAGQSVACTGGQSVAVTAGALAAPAGTAGAVEATVSCTVSLSDLAVAGLPGSKTMTATGRYAINTYAQRG